MQLNIMANEEERRAGVYPTWTNLTAYKRKKTDTQVLLA
jgi:hypothetical protein